MKLQFNTCWIPASGNPVLPPVEGSRFDSTCCMNPWAVRHGGEYWLYYAGGDPYQGRAICLATARISDLGELGPWQRHGPVLGPGTSGDFDARWAVLPHVVPNSGKWLLYYTGNSGVGQGLAQFPGLGLAVSEDSRQFTKFEANPVLARTGHDGDPEAQGIAGGSVLEVILPDGRKEWRYYYTGCPTLGEDLFLDQQKIICLATSSDGYRWEKRGPVMSRRSSVDYENVAVAGAVVQQAENGSYRMWYSAIGTRWGAYSICYAESEDGLTWNRGTHYGDNLQLGPSWKRGLWETNMVEYPSVIAEGEGLRLFYCANGYGQTGIGTAVSTPLRATREDGGVHVCHARSGEAEVWELIREIRVGEAPVWMACDGKRPWLGPDPDGTIWFEESCGADLVLRVIVGHGPEGLKISVTLHNAGKDKLAAATVQLASPRALKLVETQLEFGVLEPGQFVTRKFEVKP